MHQISEYKLQTTDGIFLYYQKWHAKQPKGSLIITHGHGEHSDSYLRVVEALKPLSLDIYAWDLRGHGRSEGQRGYAPSFTHYIDDYSQFIGHLDQQFKIFSHKVFVLAHSLGGLVQLRGLQNNPQWKIQAQVLSGPLLDVSVDVPLIKDFASLLASKIFPRLTLGNQIKNSDLSRDQNVIPEYEQDVLRHEKMSPGVYLGFIENSMLTQKYICPISTLVQIAEHDPVVSSQKIIYWSKKQNPNHFKLIIYPDRKHEIYNDLYREQVFGDLIQFLKENI